MSKHPLPPPAAKPPQPVERSRLVVSETVYFQGAGQDPVAHVSQHSRWLESDEQPWIRRFKASQEWHPFNLGWLEEASLLCLANAAPHFSVNPTDEERQEAEAKIVELGLTTDIHVGLTTPDHEQYVPPVATFALLRPGGSLRFTPADPASLRVRCRLGTAQLTLTLIPK